MNDIDQIIAKIRAGQYALYDCKYAPLQERILCTDSQGESFHRWVGVTKYHSNTLRAVKARLSHVYWGAYGRMSYIHPEDHARSVAQKVLTPAGTAA